jgi:SSS family solute:Na+ symporter
METVLALELFDGLVIVGYLLLVMYVGLRAGKFTTTTHDFFLGGQRFSWWLAAISCVATLVGSYSFQQYSEIGYKFGFCAMGPYTNEWFVLPIFLLGWLPIVYYSRVQSIPEYFQRRFDTRTRLAVLVVLIIYLEVYIGVNLLTIGLLMNQLIPLDPLAWGEAIGVAGPLQMSEWLSRGDWGVLAWAASMAVISAIYMHSGGQNSEIATDLLQGIWLLIVGLVIFLAGVAYLGGFDVLWRNLSPAHRLPFAGFNAPPGLNAVGDFWGDAVVGTFAFYMINQGIMMRVLAVRAVPDARKAILSVVLVMMPLAALAVSGIGFIGKALEVKGELPAAQKIYAETDADVPADRADSERAVAENIFILVTRQIFTIPGMFGLILSAVIAALLSTIDTYIIAVSSLMTNDVLRVLTPDRSDAFYLRCARFLSALAAVLGLGMIPLHSLYDSVYQTLSACTSFIIPPLVVVLCLAITWRGFTSRAAFWTLVFGAVAMVGSNLKPELILPISHGVSMENGFPYLRSLFGLLAAAPLAVGITWFDCSRLSQSWLGRVAFWTAVPAVMGTIFVLVPHDPLATLSEAERARVAPTLAGAAEAQPQTTRDLAMVWVLSLAIGTAIAWTDTKPSQPPEAGLVMSTLREARAKFKGAPPSDEHAGASRVFEPEVIAHPEVWVRLPRKAMDELALAAGDLVHVSDARWWLGGFRSAHARIAPADEQAERAALSSAAFERAHLLAGLPVRVTKIM